MGEAITLPKYMFKGYTVAIFAGGVSITQEQVDLCRDAGCKAIAINDGYKLAPWADILYACDNQWWRWHNGAPDFKGWKITHEQVVRYESMLEGKDVPDPIPYDLDYIVSNGELGFDNKQDRIKHGGNGGYQALQIALKLGASKIILVGYDMHAKSGKSHWFGEHPNGNQGSGRYKRWIECYEDLADRINHNHIYNCTPDSALECFQKEGLKDVLTITRKQCIY